MLAQWAPQYTLAVPFPIWPGRRAPVPGYVQADAFYRVQDQLSGSPAQTYS
jgi:hypothetical protein